MKKSEFYSRSGLSFTLVALLSFGSIFSISAEEEEDSAEVAEEIVVTGSRIKRADNISSPTPMVTLGEDQIEKLPLQGPIAQFVESFVEQHFTPEVFVKRKRDKARIDADTQRGGDARLARRRTH